MARPGRRGPADGRKVRGLTGDEHQVWVEVGFYRHSLMLHPEGATIMRGDKEVPVSGEQGPTVTYMVLGPNGPRATIDLTHLTHEELKALREFYSIAFTLAEPIVLARDKEAQDAFDAGNDSFTRVYRAVPQLVVRPRARRAHDQVVRLGLERVLAGGWSFLRGLIPARGAGPEVDERNEGEGGPQDDGAAAD